MSFHPIKLIGLDPQLNPTIVFPVVTVLVVLLAVLWVMRADARLRWGISVLLALVVLFFLISRTPLF